MELWSEKLRTCCWLAGLRCACAGNAARPLAATASLRPVARQAQEGARPAACPPSGVCDSTAVVSRQFVRGSQHQPSRASAVPRGSDLSVSESGYSTSDTVSVFKYSNCIFMMSISNHILSGMVDTIRIRIQIRTEIWKQIWYQCYPSVSDPFSSLPTYHEKLNS
jgi:hypothetical protein